MHGCKGTIGKLDHFQLSSNKAARCIPPALPHKAGGVLRKKGASIRTLQKFGRKF